MHAPTDPHTQTCVHSYIMKLLDSRRQRDGVLGMVTEDPDSDCQTQLFWAQASLWRETGPLLRPGFRGGQAGSVAVVIRTSGGEN